MPTKTMEIQFPAAGVVRRQGLRAATGGRGPFPAPWATNVRLEDGITNRLRGGSFTGISAGARSGPVYRDRAITYSGRVITAAKQGDSSDTALSVDVSDVTRPIIFQLAEAGSTGPTVVSVAPHKDAHLFGFSSGETWVLAGDPATGTLRRVSDEVGIIASGAWCFAHDTLYFLSSAGLYSVGADGGGLKPLSEDRIPEDLTSVSDSTCTLTYNHPDRGVYIHLASGVSWFYDTVREGFWPFTTDTTDSHVLMGPFRLGQVGAFGRALRVHGMIATGSDDVNWRLVTGDSAEDAAANGKAAVEAAVAGNDYASYVASEGTWSAGRAHRAYPRCRAVWCCLWLHSEGDWAYEGASLTATLSGQWR